MSALPPIATAKADMEIEPLGLGFYKNFASGVLGFYKNWSREVAEIKKPSRSVVKDAVSDQSAVI